MSYTTEIDFRDETTDDVVEIYLSLAPNRFNRLVELIKDRRADIVQIRLGRVSGFYSEWSPSISTKNIKILTALEDMKIIFPNNCEITPPRLGDVGEFNISITQRNILNPKQDLRQIDMVKLFEEPDGYEEDVYERQGHAESQPDVTSLLLAKLGGNEIALAKLRTPLWLILFVLLFLLIK